MTSTARIKVFVNHKPVGWLREISAPGYVERVITLSQMRGTKFKLDSTELSWALFNLPQPERETPMGKQPVVTFQMVLQ